MIEVVYKAENEAGSRTSTNIKLPKNVTQVGTGGNGKAKIYIENATITHIQQPCEGETMRYGVLIGTKEQSDSEFIFIKDYVDIPVKNENIIEFNDDIWLHIYDEIKKDSKEGEIVGWYITNPAGRSRSGEHYKKLHLDNFAGINKVLINHDGESEEDFIYIYDEGMMKKQSVYYVFWGSKVAASHIKKGNNEKEVEKMSQTNMRPFGKMPWGTVAVITVLVGVLAYMGNAGMLSSLTNRAKSVMGDVNENTFTTVFDASVAVNVIGGNVTTTPEVTSMLELDTTTSSEETTSEKMTTEEITVAKEPESTSSEPESTEASAAVSGTKYIVKAGETLYDISRAHYGNIDMIDEIIEANNIEDANKILTGQKLILP